MDSFTISWKRFFINEEMSYLAELVDLTGVVQLPVEVTNHLARRLLCVPQGMEVLPESAWHSTSHCSSALYPADLDLQAQGLPGGILLQLLLANEERSVYTSKHYHKKTTERFYPLLGTTHILIGRSGWRKLRWRTVVHPTQVHQLRVDEGGAINLIRMEGPFHPRDKADHYYV